MKVNNDGTQSSSWNFGGSYNEVGNYAQEVSGGYFISGFTESFGRGLYDAWIIKIDDNGNKIYDHTFINHFEKYLNNYIIFTANIHSI